MGVIQLALNHTHYCSSNWLHYKLQVGYNRLMSNQGNKLYQKQFKTTRYAFAKILYALVPLLDTSLKIYWLCRFDYRKLMTHHHNKTSHKWRMPRHNKGISRSIETEP